jgi:hypothetical protein
MDVIAEMGRVAKMDRVATEIEEIGEVSAARDSVSLIAIAAAVCRRQSRLPTSVW